MIIGGVQPEHIHEGVGGKMAGREDTAIAAMAEVGQEQLVFAGEHGKAFRTVGQQLQRLRHVAGGVLHADDVGQFRQPQQGVVAEIDRGPVRDVVDQNRAVGGFGDCREVLAQSVLGWAVVIGANREDAGEIVARQPPHRADHLASGVTADADEHRRAPGHRVDGLGHQRVDLVIVEGGRLAGGAQRHEAGDAGCEEMVDKAAIARKVDVAVLERRDERREDAGECGHGPDPAAGEAGAWNLGLDVNL